MRHRACVIVCGAGVDAIADLFRGVRAQGALSTLSAPWSLRFVDGAPLTLRTVLEGSGWVVVGDHPPEHLSAGEMVVRGPDPFAVLDRLGTPAEPLECGERSAAPERGGTRHRLGWHDPGGVDQPGAAGATTLVVGADPVRGEVGRRLLEAVPALLQVDAGGAAGAVRDLVAVEVAVDAPGQQVVLDRLVD